MPKWRIGDKTFRRKNLYIPCVIASRMDELRAEKQAEIYKKTWWADFLTEREWRTILRQNPPRHTSVVKSMLKKKAAGWLVALGRLATFEPELYNASVTLARDLSQDLIGEPHPLLKEEGHAKT
jgi:hypothetical protein